MTFAEAAMIMMSKSPVIEPLTITSNGEYTAPAGVHGYNPITVNVSATTESIIITENGVYTPPEGVEGFSSVTVQVAGGGGEYSRINLIEEATVLAELNITDEWSLKVKYSASLNRLKVNSLYPPGIDGNLQGWYTGEQIWFCLYKNAEFRFAYSANDTSHGITIVSISNTTPNVMYQKASSGLFYLYYVYGVSDISVKNIELSSISTGGIAGIKIYLHYTKYFAMYDDSGTVTRNISEDYDDTSGLTVDINPYAWHTADYPNAITRGDANTYLMDTIDFSSSIKTAAENN